MHVEILTLIIFHNQTCASFNVFSNDNRTMGLHDRFVVYVTSEFIKILINESSFLNYSLHTFHSNVSPPSSRHKLLSRKFIVSWYDASIRSGFQCLIVPVCFILFHR